jgi:hypothetical protein
LADLSPIVRRLEEKVLPAELWLGLKMRAISPD